MSVLCNSKYIEIYFDLFNFGGDETNHQLLIHFSTVQHSIPTKRELQNDPVGYL